MKKPAIYIKLLSIGLLAVLLTAGLITARQNPIDHLTAKQTADLIAKHNGDSQFVIVDVRTPAEFKNGHIRGAVLMNFYGTGFAETLKRLDRSKTYLFYCRSGNRSGQTMAFIKNIGFKKLYHLKNGIIKWRREGMALVK